MSEVPTDSPIAEALANAQAEMPNAVLNKVNPHFKSKYADLSAIRDATLPSLTKHGLSICQVTRLDDRGFFVITRLTHKSGQIIESEYPIPLDINKPQVMGSAITYARRYSWAGICGVAAEEDDDANAAQEGGKVRKSSAAAKRDGDWDKFLHDLSDVQSAVGLERLRTDYRKTMFPKWNKDWQQQFEEECEAKLAAFSQGESLKETLQASVEADNPTPGQIISYEESKSWLEGASDKAELDKRATDNGYTEALKTLTEQQREALRGVYRARAAVLAEQAADA